MIVVIIIIIGKNKESLFHKHKEKDNEIIIIDNIINYLFHKLFYQIN